MQNKLLLVLTVLSCIFSTVSFSQEWTYRKYNESNLLPSNFVNDLSQDKDDALILATDVGLYRFNGTSISAITPSVFFSKVKRFNEEVYALSKDGVIYRYKGGVEVSKLKFQNHENWNDVQLTSNFIYAISDKSLAIRNSVSGKERIITSKFGLGLKLIQLKTKTIAVFENGLLVFENGKLETETQIQGIINVKSLDKTIEVLTSENRFVYLLEDGLVPFATEESKNVKDVALLANKAKVYLGERTIRYTSKNGESFTIASSNFLDHGIHLTFVDNHGGLWLAEKGKGLFYIPSPEILRFYTDSEINKIIDWREYVVFATNGGLVINRFGYPINSLLNGRKIYDVVGAQEVMYVTTEDGLYKVDTAFIPELISEEVFTQLLLDQSNRTLYGSTKSKGLVSVSTSNYVHQYFDISAGLSHNVVTDFCIHRDTLYLVTPAGGFDRIYEKRLLDKEKNVLSTTVFNSLFSYNDELLYAASPNSGIYEFGNKNEKISMYGFNHLVYSIFSNQNQLWVTHDKGLDILLSKKEYFALFKPEDPTDFLPFSNGLHQSKDELFLGIKGGFLRVEPQKNLEGHSANLRISELSLNDQVIVVDSVLELPFQKHRFKIKVDNIDFRKGNSGIIEYRVSNFSPDWRVMKDDVLEIPELSEGDYIVQFRFKNNPGAELTSLKILIAQPIWKRLWFWLIITIVLAAIIYLLLSWRVRALRADKIRLEGLVDLRTIALRRKNDELKQLSYVISHDFKNPIINITTISEMLSSSSLPQDKKEEAYSHLTNTSRSLYTNLLGMIELLKIDDNSKVKDEFNLGQLIDEIIESISTQVMDSGTIITQKGTDILMNTNRFYIHSAMYNLLINAIKYRSDKTPDIRVIVEQNDKEITVSIADNGLGFNSVDQTKLFAPFQRIHNHTEGSGLGLALVKRMIESLGGSIRAEGIVGEGCTMHITLPFN